MTSHGREEMEAEGLTVFDVEHCILTGDVVERQKDRETAEWKYLVQGKTLGEENAVTVAKIAPTGKLVMTTVWLV
jgi:hypothetical protein